MKEFQTVRMLSHVYEHICNEHQVHFFEIPAKMRDIDGTVFHFLAVYLIKKMIERGHRTHTYYD